jgi:hypothetical protein
LTKSSVHSIDMGSKPKAIGQRKQERHGLIKWGVPALIFGAVLLAYMQVLAGDFSFVAWDDDITIYWNLHIRKLDAESVTWMFTDSSYVRRYVPLFWLTLAINYQMGGLNPQGYHAVNVLMHACNAVLLFWLLKRLCEMGFPERAKDTVLVVAAAAGALLWALHPLRVEGVAWATGRIYPQCTLFFLISMLCYLRAVTSLKGAAFKTPMYWISVLAFAASLCTHQLAITLVGVLIVMDIYPLKRFDEGLGRWSNARAIGIWLEKVPFLLLSVAILGVTYWARIHASGLWAPSSTWDFSLGARIMQSLYVEAYYVWRPWWLTGYSPVYPALGTNNFFSLAFVFSAILVAVMTVGAVLLRKRFPILLALWCCHVVLLLPVVGWFEHPHSTPDRYSYIQGMLWSVLLCVSVLWGGARLNDERLKQTARIAAVVLLVILGMQTLAQQMVWKDSERLFRYVIATLGEDPYRADLYWRLGKVYALKGRWAEALQNFDEAIRINPKISRPYFYKAQTLNLMLEEFSKNGAAPEQLMTIHREAEKAMKIYRDKSP